MASIRTPLNFIKASIFFQGISSFSSLNPKSIIKIEKSNPIPGGKYSTSINIKLRDDTIPVLCSNPDLTEETILYALNSQKFLNWLQKFDNKDHHLKSITIRDVFMFRKDVVGFISINCDVVPKKSQDGNVRVPGYVFLRGDAVAILVIVIDKETKKKYILLTKQFRVPFGDYILDVPAGMMDDKKNFKGQAAVELKEETGIDIQGDDLKELVTVGPSLGGCDESVKLFYVEIYKSHKEIVEIKEKLYGNQEEGEIIKVEMVEFDIPKIMGLMKVFPTSILALLFAYQNLVPKP